MSIFAWIVIVAVSIFAVLVVIGLLCIAADEGDVYDEQECRATVERSNGLEDDEIVSGFGEEQLAAVNRKLKQYNEMIDRVYGLSESEIGFSDEQLEIIDRQLNQFNELVDSINDEYGLSEEREDG